MSPRIYVRGPNWLGDVVMATPVLRSLRRQFPRSHVVLGLRPYAMPLLEGTSLVDELLAVPAGGLMARLRHAADLRRRNFDLALLLTNSFGSALDVMLAGIPRRRGYRGDGRSFLLNEGVDAEREAKGGALRPMPMTLFYQGLIADLGCKLEAAGYELSLGAADEAEAQAFLDRQGLSRGSRLVGLNPGAKFGSSKLWDAERFAKLANLLREAGHCPILLGGPGEELLLRQISSGARDPLPGGAADILPIGPLKALIRRLDLLVTTDTGPRAIAQAFDVPTVVLMGPTHPAWTDFNNEKALIIRHDVPCGPCHQNSCHLEHQCMTQIDVQDVFRAAEELLRRDLGQEK